MPNGTWGVDASGTWGISGNWSGGTVASGIGSAANFTNNITATRTVTNEANRTIGDIYFSDNGALGQSWVLARSSTAVLDLYYGSPGVSGQETWLSTTTNATITAVLSSTSWIQKRGTARLTLSAANTISTPITVVQGTLEITNANSLGAPASNAYIEIQAGTELILSGAGVTFNRSLSNFYLSTTLTNSSGVNTLSVGTVLVNFSANNAVFNITGGALTISAALTNGQTTTQVIKTGGSDLYLTNTGSTYVSSTTITNGYIYAGRLADVGAASSLGQPASGQATILFNPASGTAGLYHYGGAATELTDRNLSFTGAAGTTLSLGVQSSTGGLRSITYSATGSLSLSGSGTRTINFYAYDGVSSGTFARAIGNGTGTTAITKTGSGQWTISGSITASGLVQVQAGTLSFSSTSQTLSGGLQLSGGSTLASFVGSTVNANTTFTGAATASTVFTGASTLTVSAAVVEASPAKMYPNSANGTNTYTGDTTISGCVDLKISTINVSTAGNGMVLGQSNTTTVNSGGIIRTYGQGTTQNGQARYNNLRLENGSKMRIGFAA